MASKPADRVDASELVAAGMSVVVLEQGGWISTGRFDGAHRMRFTPSDFRVRSLDGVADDWLFRYDDLARFHAYVEDAMGVSGLSGNPAHPDGAPCPLPPPPMGNDPETRSPIPSAACATLKISSSWTVPLFRHRRA